MDNFFLFTRHLKDSTCLCLKVDSGGALIAPPASRDFTEIKELQKNSNTLVIETSLHATLLNLELTWLPERKARAAIPYALEDKLAEPVEALHFAFDKAHYQNKNYLITVLSKQRMRFIMEVLQAHDIEFSAITLDWFALEPQELCVTEDILLINTDDFKGALSGELATLYLKNHSEHPPLLFTDSQLIQDPVDTTPPTEMLREQKEDSHEWIAKRILKSKFVTLCQGEMHTGRNTEVLKKRYQLAAALLIFWLISLVAVNGITVYLLNKQIQKLDNQIAVIYREFFPEAKQVISPKFRIMQLLNNNNTEEQARFLFLLNQFAQVMKNNQATLEQVRYQNKTLFVTLISADFSSLEHLENELKKLQLQVKQTQASTHEQQVVATLELK